MGDVAVDSASLTDRSSRPLIPPLRWVRQWSLWSAPRQVIVYVLAVDTLGVSAAAATAILFPVTKTDLVRFGVLAVCAAVHIDLSRAIERQREVASGHGPYLDLKSVWNFAALLVLPPVLATTMVLFTYGHAFLRIWPHHKPVAPYRWFFSCATVLLGSQAAAAALAAGSPDYPGMPSGLPGLGVIAAAGLLRWLINYSLVVGAIMLSSPDTRARQALGNIGDQVVEAGAIGLAMAAAGLLVSQPVLLLGVLIALLALHRSVLMDQFQRAARTDSKTGLHQADWWRHLADQALAKAQRRNQQMGVLIADLDYFKQVNDRLGHLAGDQVLRAVAGAIQTDVREDTDTVGRLGGEEFAILLPVTTEAAVANIAERVRFLINDLEVKVTTHDRGNDVVRDLAVSIGAAVYPKDGTTMDELMLAADGALYKAKNSGRNRVQLASAQPIDNRPMLESPAPTTDIPAQTTHDGSKDQSAESEVQRLG